MENFSLDSIQATSPILQAAMIKTSQTTFSQQFLQKIKFGIDMIEGARLENDDTQYSQRIKEKFEKNELLSIEEARLCKIQIYRVRKYQDCLSHDMFKSLEQLYSGLKTIDNHNLWKPVDISQLPAWRMMLNSGKKKQLEAFGHELGETKFGKLFLSDGMRLDKFTFILWEILEEPSPSLGRVLQIFKKYFAYADLNVEPAKQLEKLLSIENKNSEKENDYLNSLKEFLERFDGLRSSKEEKKLKEKDIKNKELIIPLLSTKHIGS